jgi:hypothetical protein
MGKQMIEERKGSQVSVKSVKRVEGTKKWVAEIEYGNGDTVIESISKINLREDICRYR